LGQSLVSGCQHRLGLHGDGEVGRAIASDPVLSSPGRWEQHHRCYQWRWRPPSQSPARLEPAPRARLLGVGPGPVQPGVRRPGRQRLPRAPGRGLPGPL